MWLVIINMLLYFKNNITVERPKTKQKFHIIQYSICCICFEVKLSPFPSCQIISKQGRYVWGWSSPDYLLTGVVLSSIQLDISPIHMVFEQLRALQLKARCFGLEKQSMVDGLRNEYQTSFFESESASLFTTGVPLISVYFINNIIVIYLQPYKI